MKQEILQPMAVYVLLLGCTPNIDWRWCIFTLQLLTTAVL